jgi:hypothetical protein
MIVMTFRLRVGSLMFLVWLAALVLVAAVDVHREYEARSRVEVLDEQIDANGTRTVTLSYNHRTSWYVGGVPLGPCPAAVFSLVAIVVSVLVWVGRRRMGRRSPEPRRE